jgi:protein-tyrosine phosphatase
MKTHILFVCLGNICRSPTAQGIFEQVVKQQQLDHLMNIDSAGTHAYHIGEQPDPRSQAAAKKRGVNLSTQRARKAEAIDFERFDYILAMDRSNYENLRKLADETQQQKLHLFMRFSEQWAVDEVPDPYYGGSQGFERVLDMVEDASKGLLGHILQERYAHLAK